MGLRTTCSGKGDTNRGRIQRWSPVEIVTKFSLWYVPLDTGQTPLTLFESEIELGKTKAWNG